MGDVGMSSNASYINSDEYSTIMANINVMKDLDYTMYDDSSKVAIFIDSSNKFNLTGNGQKFNESHVSLCKDTGTGTDFSRCGLYYNAEELLNKITITNNYEGSNSDSSFNSAPLEPYDGHCKKGLNMKHCSMYVKDSYINSGGCNVDNMCDILKDAITNSKMDLSNKVATKDTSNQDVEMTIQEWLETPATNFYNNTKTYSGNEDSGKCFDLGTEVSTCNLSNTIEGELSAAVNAGAEAIKEGALAESEIMSEFNLEQFQCFYNRYKQPLNNYVQESVPIAPSYTLKLEKVEKRFHLENDLTTSLYIGSISILGLYMLYRLMEK
jgi:hypothetical protein